MIVFLSAVYARACLGIDTGGPPLFTRADIHESMNVGRRDLLKVGAVGIGAFAGCTESPNDEGETGESEPSSTEANDEPETEESEPQPEPETEEETPEPALYSESDREGMIPGVDIFPDGWKEADPGEEWDAGFSNEDETILVGLGIRIEDTVDGAKEEFEKAKAGFEANDYPIADEAFWAERADNARTFFRHSNAMGQAVAGRQSGDGMIPDTGRAQRYAEEMYNHWETLDTVEE